ncbi:MAG: hypothetical protein V3R64_04800, partial [Sphingomonadales bacterium]
MAKQKTPIQEQRKAWVISLPIEGVFLSREINRQLKIGNFYIYDSKKFFRIRNKLGFIDDGLFKIDKFGTNKKKWFQRTRESYLKSPAVIVTKRTGVFNEIHLKVFSEMRDILNILALSQLGLVSRGSLNPIRFNNEEIPGFNNFIFSSRSKTAFIDQSSLTGFVGQLTLNKAWKD